MLDMNNLPKQKHEDICKIFDLILVALFAVFFILSLFPYYSVSEGEQVTSRGYSITASEDDSWSLLGYVGFPYNHTSVEDWQAEMYSQNKDTISENKDNGYKGLINSTLGKLGINLGEGDYQALAVPGITTKTISIKQIGGILFLDVFGLIAIGILLGKKGSARAIFCLVWGIVGVLAFQLNYLLSMGTTWVRPAMLAITVIVLLISLVNSVFYIMDGRSRSAYLRSVSAAYA